MDGKSKTPKTRKERSQAELQSDSRTLCYELRMLIQLSLKFSTTSIQADELSKNALIEAFAVHCRSLISFLFGHKFTSHETDVIAFDFHRGWANDCPEFTDVMAQARTQASKHVAHITEERRDLNQPGSSYTSTWDLHAATSAICSALSCFFTKASPGNFDTTALFQMKDLIDTWNALTNVQTYLSVELTGNQPPAHRPSLVSAVGMTSVSSNYEISYNNIDKSSDLPPGFHRGW